MRAHCEDCEGDDCDGFEDRWNPAQQRVSEWLDRQRIKPGGISKEAREAVELLIDDLEAGDA